MSTSTNAGEHQTASNGQAPRGRNAKTTKEGTPRSSNRQRSGGPVENGSHPADAWIGITTVLKEVLASPAATTIADLLVGHLGKAKERTALARESVAKSYASVARVNNAMFLVALCVCLFFLGWLVHELKGDKDLLLPVLSAMISLIAGAGGGFVFGRHSMPPQGK